MFSFNCKLQLNHFKKLKQFFAFPATIIKLNAVNEYTAAMNKLSNPINLSRIEIVNSIAAIIIARLL